MYRCFFSVFLFVLFSFWELTHASWKKVESVDGSWSMWSAWSQCSVTCGQGERKRFRSCSNPAPNFGGRWCSGPNDQFGECVAPLECPVDGSWSEWGLWTACSASCGQGTRQRYRACDNPQPQVGGRHCRGNSQETDDCAPIRDCPRDGHWSSWSKWSMCSVTCGGGGTRLRYRSCNNPPPSGEGAVCPGPNRGSRECAAAQECPVNGMWAEWTRWTQCSVTCGVGERQRWRTCSDPPPSNDGSDCDRTESGDMEIRLCNASVVNCPVNGEWSEWGEWGSCNSPDCGSESDVSFSYRQRSCKRPLAQFGGTMCQGTFLQAGLCVLPQNCRVDGSWSHWSPWTCTKTLAKRSRRCDSPPPTNGGKPCPPDGALQWFSRDQNADSYNTVCSHFTNDDEDMENSSGSGSGNDEESRR